jgi:hypothetical protein
MEVQVATLCDSAIENNGKLYVWGTFDTICAERVPVVHPQCAFAMRICFQPGDEGEHDLVIRFIDDDGKAKFELPPAKLKVKLPSDAYFLTRNQVLNINRLPFEKAGQYSLDVLVDGEMLTRIPLRVMLVDKKRGQQQQQPPEEPEL